MKIIKGDRVVVLAGKDKALRASSRWPCPRRARSSSRASTSPRSTRPRPADQQGGIIDKAMPIDASNVAVISPKDGKATRSTRSRRRVEDPCLQAHR